MRAMPTGSYLTLSHATADFLPPFARAALTNGTVPGSSDFTSRTRTQIEEFFTLNDLTVIPPGDRPQRLATRPRHAHGAAGTRVRLGRHRRQEDLDRASAGVDAAEEARRRADGW